MVAIFHQTFALIFLLFLLIQSVLQNKLYNTTFILFRVELHNKRIIKYLRFIESSYKLNLELQEDVLLNPFFAFEKLAQNLECIYR